MSKLAKDPLYKLARQIDRQLQCFALRGPIQLLGAMRTLGERCGDLCRVQHRLQLANRHGWLLAAARLRKQLLDQLPQLQHATECVQHQAIASQRYTGPEAPLPLLFAELKQLHEEFEEVSVHVDDEVSDRITVTTDAIQLEGLSLGRFSIQLHLKELARDADSTAFRCVALEPNEAGANEYVTHPHVSDERICAGDANRSLATALCQGRLCDAFLLVNSVLHEYNPGSAYVQIDEWETTRCPDCEGHVSGSLLSCERCGSEACDECMSLCDACDQNCCRDCLEYDPVSGQDCCRNCRGTCQACQRIVVNEDLDPSTQLCPQCLAKRQAEPSPPLPQENPREPQPASESVQAA